MSPRSDAAAPVAAVARSLDPAFAARLRERLEILRPTRALVDLDAVAANFSYLRERAAGAGVLCVVKADAYGHGAVAVARRLEREGASMLGVAILEEGEELRRWGVRCGILLLGGAEEPQLPRVVELGLIPAVISQQSWDALARLATRLGRSLRCHLKVDTGMTRLGIPWQQFPAFAEGLSPGGPVEIEGLFTHLATSDDPSVSYTRDQLERFRACREALARRGFGRPLLHVASSAGLLTRAETDVELVRPGVALYGLNPWGTLRDPMLTPSLTLVSRVIRAESAPMGTAVGYGCTFIAPRDSRFATIPIGYEDGIPRQLGDGWEIWVGGRLAPLVGRVSMDLVVADVTDSADAVRAGDEAVIVGGGGSSGAHSVEEMARRLRTIPYEVTCGISARVPRVFLEGGEIVGISSRFGTLLPDPPADAGPAR